MAELTGLVGGHISVVTSRGDRFQTDTYFPANPDGVDQSDHTALLHLSDATLLHNTRMRYLRDEIYTYVGPILVSVNPFKCVRQPYPAPCPAWPVLTTAGTPTGTFPSCTRPSSWPIASASPLVTRSGRRTPSPWPRPPTCRPGSTTLPYPTLPYPTLPCRPGSTRARVAWR